MSTYKVLQSADKESLLYTGKHDIISCLYFLTTAYNCSINSYRYETYVHVHVCT